MRSLPLQVLVIGALVATAACSKKKENLPPPPPPASAGQVPASDTGAGAGVNTGAVTSSAVPGSAADFQQQAGNQVSLAPQLLRSDVQSLQRAIEKLSANLEVSKSAPGTVMRSGDTDSIEQLADAVASLVTQMREEQKMVRQWAQGQQTQQNEIQRLLVRATGPLARGTGRARAEDER